MVIFSRSAHAVAALRRAALLAGILAVVAGFLGMHIVAGSHGLHSQAPVSGSAAPAAGGHAAVPSSASANHLQSHHDAVPAVPPSCDCQGGCAETTGAHVGCTPSPSGASFHAPQPGTLPAAISWARATADRQPAYPYLPGTPTPRDLSISRT